MYYTENKIAQTAASGFCELNLSEVEIVNGGRLSVARYIARELSLGLIAEWLYDNGSNILEASERTPLPNLGFH